MGGEESRVRRREEERIRKEETIGSEEEKRIRRSLGVGRRIKGSEREARNRARRRMVRVAHYYQVVGGRSTNVSKLIPGCVLARVRHHPVLINVTPGGVIGPPSPPGTNVFSMGRIDVALVLKCGTE